MMPAEIFRWRLVNGEIDGIEYAGRLTKLNGMIAAALAKNRKPVKPVRSRTAETDQLWRQ